MGLSAWSALATAPGLALAQVGPADRPTVSGAFTSPISADLLQATRELDAYLQRSSLGSGDSLAAVFRELFRQPTAYFDHAVLRDRAAEVIHSAWGCRIRLRHALARIPPEDTAAARCANAARDLLRAIRYIEDYTAELVYRPAPARPGGVSVLRGEFPELLVHPDRAGFDRDSSLRSGDLLLSRGGAFTSATVARLADVPSQFSHVAILAVDSVGGRAGSSTPAWRMA